ncbi:UNVERIFIED_CONTAM: hypothetical protein FKN15_028549, partial [Acipenser sinensis]
GVTFLAFGNGAPDVFSAVAAFADPRTAGLAIGALFGAGVFVTTVVAGSVALVKPFTVASRPFLRDVIFYMWAVFWTFLILYLREIKLGEALGYLGLYVLYVGTVIVSTLIYNRQKNRLQGPIQSSYTEPELPSDSEDATPGIFNGGIRDDDGLLNIEGEFPVWALVLLIGVFLSAISFLTTSNQQPPRLHCTFSLLGFVVSAMWINTAATEVVSILRTFGVVFDLSNTVLGLTLLAWGNSIGGEEPAYQIPNTKYPATPECRNSKTFSLLGFVVSAMWINTAATEVVSILRTFGVVFDLSNTVLGLTLLAWGNSIGDCFSDITMARQGYPRMAMAACFGGIIFSILLCAAERESNPRLKIHDLFE